VSRYFSENVGPVLTKINLPPENGCTVTLVDTRQGDEILKNSHSEIGCPFGHVDSIVLVFDVSRVETFHRLNNLWLPLIEHFFDGNVPVVVAGNKVDATEDESEPHRMGPTSDQIVSLLKNFKFVRELIKCSAKELFNVDKVFREAVSSVLFPIEPIYDLDRGKLAPAFERALTRTFRVFDVDKDGLLSDNELKAFQRKVWGVALTEQDIERWKTMISTGSLDEVMRDGKITLRGFLQIFDMLVTKENKCSVPWRVLAVMKYDNDLNLILPEVFDTEPNLKQEEITYLEEVFRQYSSSGSLSSENIQSVFCVCDQSLPPWDKRRRGMFGGCHSFPRPAHHQEVTPLGSPECSPPPSPTQSHISTTGISITSSPLPSIDTTSGGTDSSPPVSYTGEPMSLLSWLSHWHMLCVISPTIARDELYRLGYVSKRQWNLAKATARNNPSITVKVLVLTDSVEEKGRARLIEQLLRRLHGSKFVRDCEDKSFGTSCSSHEFEGRTKFLVVTNICLDTISKPEEITALSKVYDVVLLPFNDTDTFDVARQVEHRYLTDDSPRIFASLGESCKEANEHCIRMDLEPPLTIDELAILHLAKCVRREHEKVPYRTTPHGERKKRAKRKAILLGGLVTAGIVVLGLSALNRRGSGQGGKGVLGIIRRILPI